jgi:hypothetical protein
MRLHVIVLSSNKGYDTPKKKVLEKLAPFSGSVNGKHDVFGQHIARQHSSHGHALRIRRVAPRHLDPALEVAHAGRPEQHRHVGILVATPTARPRHAATSSSNRWPAGRGLSKQCTLKQRVNVLLGNVFTINFASARFCKAQVAAVKAKVARC